MPTLNQQIISDIAELYRALDEHLAFDKTNCQKIDSMYKIIVTGNGDPSLPETVRTHGVWIREQIEDKKTASSRSFDYRKGVVLLVLGQVVAIGGSAIAIWMGLK